MNDIKENNIEENFEKKSKSTSRTKSSSKKFQSSKSSKKSTNPTKSSDPLYAPQICINYTNSNTVRTCNQAKKQNKKINNQPRYRDLTDSNGEKDEKSGDERSKREQKRMIIENITISVPVPERKRGRPRKSTLKTLDKNENKPQKKKQKKDENENLNEDKKIIDSDYEFIKNPLINEKTDSDSSSEDSDILVDDNTLLENSGEENQRNFIDDVYSQSGNSTNGLENRPPPEPPPVKRD